MAEFTQFLADLNVNIIYVAFLFSLWIAVTAAYIPGTGLLEVIALVTVVASVYAMTENDANWLAVFVLVVGLLVFIALPFFEPKRAQWAYGGLALQVVGGLFLFKGVVVSPILVAFVGLVSFAYHQFVLLHVLRTHRRLPDTVMEMSLVGTRGRVITELNPRGTVYAGGEQWSAYSDDNLEVGAEVVVLEQEGLQLYVEGVKQKRHEVE